MLLAIQTISNACKLIIITNYLLYKPIYDILNSLLNELCLIRLYHGFF